MSVAHGVRRLPIEGSAAQASRVVQFTFDGRDVEGIEGEPVAVALLAAGVRVFRTMPETGEARGGFCFAGRCADCLMIVDGHPGVRSCVTPLVAGMSVRTQAGLGEITN